MFFKLTLLFTTVTLIELAVLIPVGSAIGIAWTLALVVATAVVGGALAKRQGAAIWNRIQEELRQGEVPRDSLLDGVAVLIAGTLLLTPGVLTDAAGILLLIPPVRAPLRAIAKRYVRDKLETTTVTNLHGGVPPRDAGPTGEDDVTHPRDDVIDVEPSESDGETEDDILEAVPQPTGHGSE